MIGFFVKYLKSSGIFRVIARYYRIPIVFTVFVFGVVFGALMASNDGYTPPVHLIVFLGLATGSVFEYLLRKLNVLANVAVVGALMFLSIPLVDNLGVLLFLYMAFVMFGIETLVRIGQKDGVK